MKLSRGTIIGVGGVALLLALAVAAGAKTQGTGQAALPPGQGSLAVSGSPAGATVVILCPNDYSESFKMPVTVTVPAGSCRVTVTADGFWVQSQKIQVEAGQTARIELNLKPRAPGERWPH